MIEVILEIDGWRKKIVVDSELYRSGRINAELFQKLPRCVPGQSHVHKPLELDLFTFVNYGKQSKNGTPIFEVKS